MFQDKRKDKQKESDKIKVFYPLPKPLGY